MRLSIIANFSEIITAHLLFPILLALKSSMYCTYSFEVYVQ